MMPESMVRNRRSRGNQILQAVVTEKCLGALYIGATKGVQFPRSF
jgi:hypothetical protein